MTEEKKKKSIFGKAIDALTNRDEKEAEAAAKKAFEEKKAVEAAEAKRKLEAVKAEAAAAKKTAEDKLQVEADKAKLEAEANRKAEMEKAMAERKAETEEREAQRKELIEAQRKAAEKKYVAEHTVVQDDMLSAISLKYYGTAVRDYWWLIYEANKDVIGDNYNAIKPGMVLKVPELTEEQKEDIKKRKQG